VTQAAPVQNRIVRHCSERQDASRHDAALRPAVLPLITPNIALRSQSGMAVRESSSSVLHTGAVNPHRHSPRPGMKARDGNVAAPALPLLRQTCNAGVPSFLALERADTGGRFKSIAAYRKQACRTQCAMKRYYGKADAGII
jgi:hypothetical protein